MSIAAWTLVLNAIVVVLMIGYGIWLKYIIGHQLTAKDAAIAASKALTEIKDAEIAKLKSGAAPAATRSDDLKREFADTMSANELRLSSELDNLSQRQDRADLAAPVLEWLAAAKGVTFSLEVFKSNFAFAKDKNTTESQYVHACTKTLKAFDDEILRLHGMAESLLAQLKEPSS